MWIRNAYSAAARKDATAIYSPMVKKKVVMFHLSPFCTNNNKSPRYALIWFSPAMKNRRSELFSTGKELIVYDSVVGRGTCIYRLVPNARARSTKKKKIRFDCDRLERMLSLFVSLDRRNVGIGCAAPALTSRTSESIRHAIEIPSWLDERNNGASDPILKFFRWRLLFQTENPFKSSFSRPCCFWEKRGTIKHSTTLNRNAPYGGSLVFRPAHRSVSLSVWFLFSSVVNSA